MRTLPAHLPPDLDGQIARLGADYRRANGPLISLVNRLGGGIEAQMALLPERLRQQIERTTESALRAALSAAALGDHAPDVGRQGTMLAAMATGAAGGAGGLAGSVAELPFTITLMLHAIRREAVAAGLDPRDPAIAAACIEVFAAGSPLSGDDGANSAFLSARLSLTGPAVQRMIATVAPKLAAAMGQKLAAQAVPLLGALSGAALNAAYLGYYREIARIRFQLLRLAEVHGAEVVLARFAAAAAAPRITRA